MDKFGYIRGRRGPPGPPGKDALQLRIWCPESIVQQFRASATCCFYFNSRTDGILYDSTGKIPKGLKNQVDKEEHNAICLKGLKPPVKTGKSYSIPLTTDTCFEISRIGSAIKPKTVFIIAFSFKLIKPIKDDLPYYIFSNTNSSRAVTLRKDWIDIAGCARGSPQLKYLKDGWNIMLIQYSRVTREGSDDRCFFILNGRRGYFEPVVYKNDERALYIGHKSKPSANIELNYFEVHTKHFSELSGVGEYLLPETFSTLLLEDMEQRMSRFGEKEDDCDCE